MDLDSFGVICYVTWSEYLLVIFLKKKSFLKGYFTKRIAPEILKRRVRGKEAEPTEEKK